MANQLKMAKISAILTLRERGWSQRRIARELGVHRETVGRYVRLAREGPPTAGSDDSKPAKVLTGSGPPGEPKPAKVLAGSEGVSDAISSEATSGGGGRSLCEPYRPVILELLERGLSAQRIYQDLVVEHGFEGSYCSVQRFVRRLNGAGPAPFRRMECEPAAEAQVDFGTGAMIPMPNGRRRRSWVFRIILSFSRKGYSETVFRQTTDEFIRCLENAFHHFGGVPKTLVIDNLRAAVTKADWYEPELNPKIIAFAEHYGTVILPTKSYTPRHKGKVERGVDYVQDNGLKGRQFTSLSDQNRHLLHWERTVADTRIHGTTRKQVGRLFEEVERPALLPLPEARFPHFDEAQRSVHRDGHVEVAKAYYSVPPEYLGHRLWVRWDGRVVRIFDSMMRQIAVHAQREPGRFSTQDRHIAAEKISNVERGTSWLLHRAALIGPQTRRWAESVVQQRGIEGGRVLVGLLSLANRYESERIEHACRLAHGHGSYRLRMIRQLLKRSHPAASDAQEQFEFTHEHPIIRSLSDYQRLVTTSLHIVRPRKASDEPTINGNGNGNSRSHNYERHTGHGAEATSSIGDRSGPGCSSSGSGRQQPEPQRIPGTDPGR